MARQKQTAKPKADEAVKADVEKETAKNDVAKGGMVENAKAAPEQPSETAPAPSTESAHGDDSKPQPDASAAPEQASATTPEPATVTASNGDGGKVQPEVSADPPAAQKTVTPRLRRFVVFKPVRFEGKRIPRGGRVTVTRAGHDELASLGAVSSVWDHGSTVETE
ncbi:MAG: hypothetical protein ABGX47_08125 [Martelella sp.]|uniref:hypothetical protein n=1 Tax=Martelella sp. TaxID=1969699 RepID=UPI003241D48F